MSDAAAKRFWSEARAEATESGWRIALDGQAVRTPAKAPLMLPTEALARAVAEEWDAQGVVIDPRKMPLTRMANSANDKVAPQHGAVVEMLAEYGGTDLVCYRADTPVELAARQADLWDPLLDWADERFGARLSATQGVMPIAQDRRAVERLADPMRRMSPFRLAAFHDLVALSGSLVLAHATVAGRISAPETWDLSRIDEEWQADAWGRDAEADEVAARRRQDFLDAHRFWSLTL